MNEFYKQPKILQWIEAILLLSIGFLPALLIIEKGHSQPIFYLLLIFYVPVSQFTFTPFLKLIGVYKYYAPMLLGYMSNKHQIDLHSGASFDYLFVMRKYKPGIEVRNRLLIYYLEGLINIIKQIENNSIPRTVYIVGTSYFFSERTLNNLELSKLVLYINIFVKNIYYLENRYNHFQDY